MSLGGSLPPTIMEVENYPLAKETHLGGSMIMEGRGNLPYMGTSGFQKTTTVSPCLQTTSDT